LCNSAKLESHAADKEQAVKNKETAKLIGGEFCSEPLAENLLPSEPRELTTTEIDGLWRVFEEIAKAWDKPEHDPARLKSSWLEFLRAKTPSRPSYVAEYVNAIEVIDDLIEHEDKPFHRLFFDNGLPRGALGTRLAHAKNFVVDEFIKVQIVAGGFKSFVEPDDPPAIRPDNVSNHRAFIAASRYNRILPVRPYKGPSK
jgi:hypothetical protein